MASPHLLSVSFGLSPPNGPISGCPHLDTLLRCATMPYPALARQDSCKFAHYDPVGPNEQPRYRGDQQQEECEGSHVTSKTDRGLR